jgi:hypothetical protein
MPNGYGISQRGKSIASDRQYLDRLPPPGKNLVAGAMLVIRRLAAARGLDLALPPAAGSGSSSTRDRLLIALVAVAAALLAGAIAFLRRRRRV